MIAYIKIFIDTFVRVMSALLMIYCILSWIAPPYNPIRERLDGLMDRFLDPIRSRLPYFGGIDFSPIILMLILQAVETIINMIF